MAEYWIHKDAAPIFMLDAPSTGAAEQWATGEAVPRRAAVPDALWRRYEHVMPEFWRVQRELETLYDGGMPADAGPPQ